jgi:hypothetical protein
MEVLTRNKFLIKSVTSHYYEIMTYIQSQSQYSLFSLGMFTYTYERQDIIQIALTTLK